MKKRLICLILLLPLLMVGQVTADQVQEQATELIVDGDEAIFDTENQVVEFLGNVVVWYGDFYITGDKFHYQQAVGQMKVDGNVQFKGPDEIQGTAQKMEVDLEGDLLTLTGNAEIIRDGQLIRGDIVTYDLETGVFRAKKAHLKIQNIGG